jgi:four helix bundle protein
MQFEHESLDAYRMAVEVARWCARQPFPELRRHLREPLIRAADAVALRIAEGTVSKADEAQDLFETAFSSAAEACAVLDLADLPGAADRQDQLRRIGALLRGPEMREAVGASR